MSLYIRDKVWYVKLPNPDKDGPPLRQSTGLREREGAEAYEQALKAKLKANLKYFNSGKIGLGHLWLLDKARAKRDNNQTEAEMQWGIAYHWRMLMRFFEPGPDDAFDPASLTLEHIEQYIDFRINQGIKPQSYKREVQALKRGLKLGTRRYGFAMPIPLEQWPTFKHAPKDKQRRGKLWPKETVGAFLNLLSPACRDEMVFLAFTALRAAECKRIEPDMIIPTTDADVPANLVLPEWATKKGVARTVGLVPAAYDAVKRQLARRDQSRPQLWAKSDYKRERAKAKQTLGLPYNLTRRDLRHSYLSTSLANGADLKALMEMGGHTTLKAAEMYQSSTPERIRNVALAYLGKQGIADLPGTVQGTVDIDETA